MCETVGVVRILMRFGACSAQKVATRRSPGSTVMARCTVRITGCHSIYQLPLCSFGSGWVRKVSSNALLWQSIAQTALPREFSAIFVLSVRTSHSIDACECSLHFTQNDIVNIWQAGCILNLRDPIPGLASRRPVKIARGRAKPREARQKCAWAPRNHLGACPEP